MSNFHILTYIHSLISCPLGIIDIDSFSKILSQKKYREFFSDKNNLKYLGLSNKISNILNSKEEKEIIVSLKQVLKLDIEKQTQKGLYLPDDIDFAFLQDDDDNVEIWEADVLNNHKLEYFKSNELNKIEGFKNLYSEKELNDRTETYKQFAEIVSKFVFKNTRRRHLIMNKKIVSQMNPQYYLYKNLTETRQDILDIKEGLTFSKKTSALEIVNFKK
jgi:hypothetical protein